MEHVQVLIAGGGMAGLSAAIWCRRLGLRSVLLERNSRLGGQLWQIRNEIWDFPPLTYKNGEALATHLLRHPAIGKLDCRLQEEVTQIDLTAHRVKTNKQEYLADFLIVATGVAAGTLPDLAGSARVLDPEFSTTANADLFRSKDVLVIGGGDRALESACNISSVASRVWLAVRSGRLRARAEWVERLRACKHANILLNTKAVGYRDEEAKTIITLEQSDTGHTLQLPVDWVLPRIGVKGNSEPFSSLAGYGAGFLSVDSFQTTSADWIYAVGDIVNSAEYASLSLASGQAMKAVKHILLQTKEQKR